MTLQQLADLARSFFIIKNRDGAGQIWIEKPDAPDWVDGLVQEAHDGAFPNDWRYQFIVEALDALSDFDDEDEARDSLEADLYHRELLDWFGSNINRVHYVDEAAAEFGRADAVTGEIQLGQLVEKREVFELVLGFLKQREEEGGDE